MKFERAGQIRHTTRELQQHLRVLEEGSEDSSGEEKEEKSEDDDSAPEPKDDSDGENQ